MKAAAVTIAPARSRLGELLVLFKVRVNALVVATTAGGFYMASPDTINLATLIGTIAGTALVAGGAAALNQVSERDLDRLMDRTRLRPLADGRMSVREGKAIAWGACVAGVALIALTANLLAAAVAALTAVIYAFVYTPMKRVTSFSTVVGAVPGALPPVIGWAAARGSIDAPAVALFLIVFLWQLPHFLAIAWLFREDYARAALPMLPVVDPDGMSTARQALLYATALIPVSVMPSALRMAGAVYAVSAVILGFAFFAFCVRFAMNRTKTNARILFLASIVYLPLVWVVMMMDRL
ncbi:MAG: heme o synthase [Acidobacteriota bacterium]|nr:heme o synthase [Acidobacteriota bacterium]